MKARGRDVRLLGVAITAGLVGLGGAALQWTARDDAPAVEAARAAPHRNEVDLAFRQGVAMLHARRYDHAVAAFHRVLKFVPTMPEAHVNMGFALSGLGRHREARSFFEAALDLNPRQVNAYYGLGLAAEAAGDLETARGAMRTYAHLAPEGDPFRRRANAALWEWTASRPAPPSPPAPAP